MPDDLYIIAATAVKRNGPVLHRSIVLEFIATPSKEEALKKGGQKIFPRRLPSGEWSSPILVAEAVPAPRIARYLQELRTHGDPVSRLTSLWAYAIFSHESSLLLCSTIIAQTRRSAEEGILLGRGKYTRGRKDFSVEKVPSKLILPRPLGYEDPTEIFRKRFPDTIKK